MQVETFPWNIVNYFVKNVIFVTKLSDIFVRKIQKFTSIMVRLPSKLQIFPSKSENFPGMRLPNSTFVSRMVVEPGVSHTSFLDGDHQPHNIYIYIVIHFAGFNFANRQSQQNKVVLQFISQIQ